MRILMLTPYLPYPLLSGGQIRTYNLLKKLKDKHQITLFSFIRQEEEKKHLSRLKKFCPKIRVFKRRPAWDVRNVLIAGFSPFPFVMISTYLSLTVRRAIQQELAAATYDLIHAEPFYMMPNIAKTDIPILLVEQTIEYLVYKKFVDDFDCGLLKPFMYLDVKKLKLWEHYYWRQATSLVAMSEEDKEIMAGAVPDKRIDIVANGVDIDFFNQIKKRRTKEPTVLFVGNFKWLPNKDAAKFLTYKIWPLIKKAVPAASLKIVGKNPTPKIRQLAEEPGVIVDSQVEDIREAFKSAWVLLAPIRNGRGTKYKILEAVASKVPVVTTPLGIEGIEAEAGREAIIRKKAEDLAGETIKILRKPELGDKLARSAYELIEEKYNWELISRDLDKIYQRLGKKN